jgi:copper homeostasis protein
VIFEICVDSVAGVQAAKDAGADRAELCAALIEGGITPSRGMMRRARAIAGIKIQMMIRPRGGDFLFDNDEFEIMKADIDTAKTEGADGVVIGLLKSDGTIDEERSAELIARARPLSVTFHRAFDMTRDPFEALEELVSLGIDRVLTSGQEESALEGIDLLRELVARAGDRIVVMVCGNLTEKNIEKVARETSAKELHITGFADVESGMSFRNPRVYMGGLLRPPEYTRSVTASERVAALVRRVAGERAL